LRPEKIGGEKKKKQTKKKKKKKKRGDAIGTSQERWGKTGVFFPKKPILQGETKKKGGEGKKKVGKKIRKKKEVTWGGGVERVGHRNAPNNRVCKQKKKETKKRARPRKKKSHTRASPQKKIELRREPSKPKTDKKVGVHTPKKKGHPGVGVTKGIRADPQTRICGRKKSQKNSMRDKKQKKKGVWGDPEKKKTQCFVSGGLKVRKHGPKGWGGVEQHLGEC